MAVQSSSITLLYCPITRERFRDPVVGSDGHTYERESIIEWLHSHGTSPLTREPMSASSLRSNFVVKKLLEFEVQAKTKNYTFKLNVDVRKKHTRPLFQAHGKFIYEAEWLTNYNAPEVVILRLAGTRALKEADFYVKLTNHMNIVRTFGIVESDMEDRSSVMLLQEYASHGDLGELLRQQVTLPTEPVYRKIFAQISDGMSFLSDKHIVHGDLACRNILVFDYHQNDPKHILVKLTDFGLTRFSCLYETASVANTATLAIVPFRAAAPEVLRSNHRESYTEKSDMYSMAILMWEALSKGQAPWSHLNDMQQVCSKVLNGERPSQPLSCSDNLWRIIMECMADNSAHRPTFAQLKSRLNVLHPKLQQINERAQNFTSPNGRHAPLRQTERNVYVKDSIKFFINSLLTLVENPFKFQADLVVVTLSHVR
ncbi:unnamed protein product [Rotaria magnacalcarata]|uniref:Non-specific protein-tyrosine kinase n=1 Tax=Rotaria magnacalcarata TaxID=392030 RepID=A0A8S2LHZ0_9BILA|nr:unnamed protein product [Rotaria magnacalcarata]